MECVMRRYLAEFIGTFFLTLTVCCAVLGNAALAPVAIGAVLAALVFAGGHISGAHYNPAVTIAVWVRGKISTQDVPGYLAAQVAGGVLAAVLARGIIGGDAPKALSLAGGKLGSAFLAELLVTFLLGYVVLNVATSKDHPDNSFYGIAIGFTVLAGAVAVGGVSGGAFNPAVALGISSAGLVSWSLIWMYLLAEVLAGVGAGMVFRVLNPHEWAPETVTARVPGTEENGWSAPQKAPVSAGAAPPE
jgi:aquaporin Z